MLSFLSTTNTINRLTIGNQQPGNQPVRVASYVRKCLAGSYEGIDDSFELGKRLRFNRPGSSGSAHSALHRGGAPIAALFASG